MFYGEIGLGGWAGCGGPGFCTRFQPTNDAFPDDFVAMTLLFFSFEQHLPAGLGHIPQQVLLPDDARAGHVARGKPEVPRPPLRARRNRGPGGERLPDPGYGVARQQRAGVLDGAQ